MQNNANVLVQDLRDECGNVFFLREDVELLFMCYIACMWACKERNGVATECSPEKI